MKPKETGDQVRVVEAIARRFYDRQGNEIDRLTWATAFEGDAARRVAFTKRGDVRVSTVWLGLDHSFGDGPPLIFETMIFGGPCDQYQERYSTEAEARAGHGRAVAMAWPARERREGEK